MKYSNLLNQLVKNREIVFEAAKKKQESKTLSDSIGLFPGGFKPPHKGHLSAVVSALNKGIEKVIILISSKPREGSGKVWDAENSKQIWNNLLEKKEISSKVEVQISALASPVSAAYKFLEENPNIGGKNIYMIKSTKDGEGDARFTDSALQKSLNKNPKKAALENSGKAISSSDIRSMSKEERKKINPLYENN